MAKTSRGILNNNWGNIRISANKWKGKISPQTQDSSFEVFQSAAFGLRALIVLLSNYYKNYNLKTIEQIINKYAPPSENATKNYISVVAKRVGLPLNTDLDLLNNNTNQRKIVEAIVRVENGFLPSNFNEVYTNALALLPKKKE